MLRRKIEKCLEEWKKNPNRKPLLIKGIRQCGKTFSVTRFARENYDNVIYLNFVDHPEYISIFDGSLAVNDLVELISASLEESVRFVPGKTILIFDEVQNCPDARTSLKFFKEDGRFDVICTGTLFGVSGYGKQPRSVPVGYETTIEMRPLDFEEFMWACGVIRSVTDILRGHMEDGTPVPAALHDRMSRLFLRYAVVGGMPEVVQTYVDTREMNVVLGAQRNILSDYRADMVKYADNKTAPLITECFDSIPRQLGKENKKFQYSVVEKSGKAAKFGGALRWMEDASVISRCHNLTIPELPLGGNALEDEFKIYVNDTGLFIGMLDDGTQADVLRGNLYGYKGAIMENLIADVFTKMGRKLYYYRKESGLEIDFVIRHKGGCQLVEVKATTGNTKSAKTVLGHPEKYHVDGAIKLGAYNVGRSDRILTLPSYMSYLLDEI